MVERTRSHWSIICLIQERKRCICVGGPSLKEEWKQKYPLALRACWGEVEVILPSESIGKGASVRERKDSPFLEYVVFVEWKRLLSRLQYPFSVPFQQNKGSIFCNWLREPELEAGAQSPIICVWNYYSLRPLESGYCKDWAQLLWWWEKQFLLWLIL